MTKNEIISISAEEKTIIIILSITQDIAWLLEICLLKITNKYKIKQPEGKTLPFKVKFLKREIPLLEKSYLEKKNTNKNK